MQTRLIALKPLRYATRRLQPGDEFDGTAAHAKLLVQIGAARLAEVRSNDPLDIDALRATAEALGIHVDRRWGEARLNDEIAAVTNVQAAAISSGDETE